MIERSLLNSAIIEFVGYGSTVHPVEDPARLAKAFGAEKASELELEVKKLLEDLNDLKPDWSTHSSLVSAGEWAKEKMRHEHPELGEAALNALEWTFTWWWR